MPRLRSVLLFNESDAVSGIRNDGATDAVDKMENGIRNIILEEREIEKMMAYSLQPRMKPSGSER